MSPGLNEHDLNYIKFKFKLSLYDIIASTNSAFDIKLLRNLNWKLWKEELEKKKIIPTSFLKLIKIWLFITKSVFGNDFKKRL